MSDLEPPPIEGELITETRDDQEFREICEGLEENTEAIQRMTEAIGGIRKPVKMYESDFGLVREVPNYAKHWSKK